MFPGTPYTLKGLTGDGTGAAHAGIEKWAENHREGDIKEYYVIRGK